VRALLAQDGSGIAATGTAMRGVVVARPKTQLQKHPFMTCGAAINGALSGPHRAWDPV
jgi:WhiB family transcriptional regulator, redox-sensing transcriptional regulator